MAAHVIIDEPEFRQSRERRFWQNIDTSAGYDGCWPWKGTRLKSGYGAVTFLGRRTTAHRIAYELHTGVRLSDSIAALHSCDNPPCCNPRHIFPGTQKENIADMDAKGRRGITRMSGETHPRAKLSDGAVNEIREIYKAGATQAAIAKIFGVGPSQISRIIRGDSRS